MNTSHVQLSGEDLLRLHDQNILTTCFVGTSAPFLHILLFPIFQHSLSDASAFEFFERWTDLCLGAFSHITQILHIP